MKRFRLATKLALAIVPVLAVALAAGALVSWNFLESARQEERVAVAARVADGAMNVLIDVAAEQTLAIDVAQGTTGRSLDPSRAAVDNELAALTSAVGDLIPISSGPASGIASRIVSQTRRVANLVGDARQADALAEDTNLVFDEIGNNLISIVSQTILYFDTADRSREGAGATALARASVTSFQQQRLMSLFPAEADDETRETFEQRILNLETTVADWLVNADEVSPTVGALNLVNTQLTDEPAEILEPDAFPAGRDDLLSRRSSEIFNRVAIAADAAAGTARSEAGTIGAIVIGILLLAILTALLVGRSIVRRVRAVTEAARTIAEVDLPRMVDALSDPRGRLQASTSTDLELSGHDEVGDLSRSFGTLHSTLVDVANQQMDMLRRGVSEIFVTLARRNRSLVDRQLALIDDLESNEDDPDILGGYYRLDHLATRMRRNAESLLVLAGSETPRMWAAPLEVGDVVRAALGEVDEYRRVDVLAVEPARVAGRAVTDLAHLLSELLDNATQFSPPTERVRVAGLFDDEGYIITISDKGIGLSEAKMAELNRLLDEPPILGLALEPTLGMYVVGRLARRHGISVRLVAGVPGITVRVTLPRQLLETGAPAETPTSFAPASAEDGHQTETPKPEPVSTGAAPAEKPEGTRSAPIPGFAFRSPGRHIPNDGDAAPHPTAPPEFRPEPPKAPPALERPAASAPAPTERRPAPSTTPPTGERPAGSKAPEPRAPLEPPSAASKPTEPPTVERPAAAAPQVPRPGAPLPQRGVPSRPDGPIRTAGERVADSPSPALDPSSVRPATRPPEPPPSRPASAPAEEPSVNPLTGLPTRTPGAAFRDQAEPSTSTAASLRGAAGIRDALVGFKLGREGVSDAPDRSRPIDRPTNDEPSDDPRSHE
jgi:signal transduction histidine kinase